MVHGKDHVEDIELSFLVLFVTCQEQAGKELLSLLIGSLVLLFRMKIRVNNHIYKTKGTELGGHL